MTMLVALLDRWRACGACRRGISMIEFAMLAPALVLLMMGMIEVALITFVSVAVEGGLKEASRFGITGQLAANDAARRQQIRDILDDNTLGLIDLAAAVITLKTYPSFSDVGQPEPFTDATPYNGVYDLGEGYTDLNGNSQWDADRGTDGAGNAGEIVLYRIDYYWTFLVPVVGRLMGDAGRLPMTASIVVRNEPWDFTSP